MGVKKYRSTAFIGRTLYHKVTPRKSPRGQGCACPPVGYGRGALSPRDAVPTDSGISGIAHAIQLAVAPVFLVLGIGAMLGVMTSRLGRVIDRARVLEGQLRTGGADAAPLRAQLGTLALRAQLASRAITLCTITALLVCTVIAVLFVGAVLAFDPSIAVALLFIAAMGTFILGLVTFLREILLATASLRIGAP